VRAKDKDGDNKYRAWLKLSSLLPMCLGRLRVVSICVRAHSKVRARRGCGDLLEPGQGVTWLYVCATVRVGENPTLGCNLGHGCQAARA